MAAALTSGRRGKPHGRATTWREGVKKRTGSEPVIRYFDVLMVVDNEKGSVTEWTEGGDARPVP